MDGWNENAPLQPEVGRPGFNEDTTNGFMPLNLFMPISAPDHFQQQAQQAAQDQDGYFQPAPGQMFHQPWSAPLSPAQPMMQPQAPYAPGGMQSGFTGTFAGGYQQSGGFPPAGGAPVPGGQPMPVQGGYQSFPPRFTAPPQPDFGQQYPPQGAPMQPVQGMPQQAAPAQGVSPYSGPMQPVNHYAAQAPSGPYAPVYPGQQPMQGMPAYAAPMQPAQGIPPYGIQPVQAPAGYPAQEPSLQPFPGEQPPAVPDAPAPQPEPNPWNDLPPYPGMDANAAGAGQPGAAQNPAQPAQQPAQPVQQPAQPAEAPAEEAPVQQDRDPLGIPPYLRNTSKMRKPQDLPPLKKPEPAETPAVQEPAPAAKPTPAAPEQPAYSSYRRPAPLRQETPAPEAEAPAAKPAAKPAPASPEQPAYSSYRRPAPLRQETPAPEAEAPTPQPAPAAPEQPAYSSYQRLAPLQQETPAPEAEAPAAQPAPAAPEQPAYSSYQRPAPLRQETPAPEAEAPAARPAPAEAERTVVMPPDRHRRRSHAGNAAAAPQPADAQPHEDPPPAGQAHRRRRSHNDAQENASAQGSAMINGGAASPSDAGERLPFVNQAGAKDTGVESGSVRPVSACDNDSSADSAPRQRRSALQRPALIRRSTTPVYRADPEDAEYQQPADSPVISTDDTEGDPALGAFSFAGPATAAPRSRRSQQPESAAEGFGSDPAGDFGGTPGGLIGDGGGDHDFFSGGDEESDLFDPFDPSHFVDLNAPEARSRRRKELSPAVNGFGDLPFDALRAETGDEVWSPFGSAAASPSVIDALADNSFASGSPAASSVIGEETDWAPFDAVRTPENFLSGGLPPADLPIEPVPGSPVSTPLPTGSEPLPSWDPFDGQQPDIPLFTTPADDPAVTGPDYAPDLPLSSDILSELFSSRAQETERPAYGASSYDAGAMPNPSLGDLPYAAVSAFRTDNPSPASLLSDVSAGAAAPVSDDASPEEALTPLGEPPAYRTGPQPPAGKAARKPSRKPSGNSHIKLSRLLLLLTAVGMLLFCIAEGGRILIAFVQNTEEVSQLADNYESTTGRPFSEAGETVTLPKDGSTFPPSRPAGQSIYYGYLTGQVDAQQNDPSASGGASAGKRTRLSEYPLSQRFSTLEVIEEQREKTPDVVGKLIIPGLLEEWIANKEDVTYYLNHNIYNETNYYGAVFPEQYRALDTPPENLHLRGSDAITDTDKGSVFRKLWQYEEGGSNFTLNHNRATVITLHEQIDFELFAVIKASLNPAQPNYFNYFGQLSFQSDAAMMDYVNNARRRSIYTLPADVQPGQRLLTLSTVSMNSDTSMVLLFRSDRFYSDEYVEN